MQIGWFRKTVAVGVLRLTVAVLSGAAGGAPDGTILGEGDTVLFRADADVTFSAVYEEHAVKATVVSPVSTPVSIHVDRVPRHVFVDGTRVADDDWSYAADTGHVRLTVPQGSASLQIRFDDTASLTPVTHDLPVVLRQPGGDAPRTVLRIPVTCSEDRLYGSASWPEASGRYLVRREGSGDDRCVVLCVGRGDGPLNSVDFREGIRSGDLLLIRGAALEIAGHAPGFVLPLRQLSVERRARLAAMRRVDRPAAIRRAAALAEGEAFEAEGGGTVKQSTEHTNTPGGGCIYVWAEPGHWIAWTLTVDRPGRYIPTFVAATTETRAIRRLTIDGAPVPGAELVAFEDTGGWGRGPATEWQAFQPLDEKNNPLAVSLDAGAHRIRMENVLGEHLNIDAVLLVPREGR